MFVVRMQTFWDLICYLCMNLYIYIYIYHIASGGKNRNMLYPCRYLLLQHSRHAASNLHKENMAVHDTSVLAVFQRFMAEIYNLNIFLQTGSPLLFKAKLLPPHISQHNWQQRQKYTRAKGKTAPKKYNVAPDITRRGTTNAPIVMMI